MKKRILISCIMLAVIVLAVVVIRYIHMQRDEVQETENPGSYYESSSEIRYAPGSEYNYTAGGEDRIESGYTQRFEMDAEVIQGGVTLRIYEYDRDTRVKGDVVRVEQVTATGEYVYNLDDLSPGSYWFEINEDSEDTTANVKFRFCQERLD